MELKLKASAISTICLWGVIGLISIGFLISLFGSILSILTLFTMIIVLILVTAICVYNVVNLSSLYKQYVTISDGVVLINKGLIFKTTSFPLSQVSSVRYTRFNIIFMFSDKKPVKVDLYYIKTKESSAFVQYLSDCKVVIE